MSPVNNDDSSGVANSGAGRPLTRKEIRAQEKFLATQGHDIIPPQAFETGQEVPAAPEGPPEPADAAPAQPRTAPTVHEDPVHAAPVGADPVQPAAQHEEPVVEHPVHDDPVHDEPAHEEPVVEHPVHDEPVHEYTAGMSREETLRRADELQYGRRLQDGADIHPGYASHPDDEAHHVYDDEPGRDLIAGAAALPTAKGPSKKVRRRRRFLAQIGRASCRERV